MATKKKARTIQANSKMAQEIGKTTAFRILSMEGGGVNMPVSPGSVFTDAAHGFISIVGHTMDRTGIYLTFGGKYNAIVKMPK